MQIRKIISVLCLAVAVMLTATSCIKEPSYLTDSSARLAFSDDTVSFDTVFATMGSTTHLVKVYNRYDEALRIDAVTLRGGTASRFRINVDGDTAFVARNVDIAAGDSIFIFVQANINPNDQTSPYLVEDAIVFRFNNREQQLPLTAYGRNAVYHMPRYRVYSTYVGRRGSVDTIWYPYSIIDCANWDHTRPHVVFGYAVVNSNETLSLTAGDELYFADNGCLWVYDSATLSVHGSSQQPVLFTSLRHDGYYDSLPGQWGYIWLSTGSKDNVVDWAVVENGTYGILADTNVNGNPTLDISNSVIKNHSIGGIVGQGSYITGDNLLVSNCGEVLVALQYGGRYRFSNSTLANYWRYSTRTAPAVVLNNYYAYRSGGGTVVSPRDLLQADFLNCIIYGNYAGDNGIGELKFDYLDVAAMNCRLDHCILKSNVVDSTGNVALTPAPHVSCTALRVNRDPRFVDPHGYNYHIEENSPAIGAGESSYLRSASDLDGNPRGIPPAIGAYEWVPKPETKRTKHSDNTTPCTTTSTDASTRWHPHLQSSTAAESATSLRLRSTHTPRLKTSRR